LATAAVLAGAARLAHAEKKQPVWPAEGIEDFSLTECRGRTVTRADLLGKPWLACFIFTRCAGPCPIVSRQMETLQKRLEGLDVKLVSITVDPEHDTPEVLQEYADRHHADPERWWFLTGDKIEIFRLIRCSFMMIAQDAEKRIPGFEVEHAVTIMHVNAAGRVVGMYNATDDVDMARLRRVMLGKVGPEEQRLIDTADAEDAEQERIQQELRRKAEAEWEAKGADEFASRAPREVPEWVLRLPAINASLNGLATVLLLAGYALIKSGRRQAHETAMLSAFATSTLFLAFYLVYHFSLYRYTGEGSRRFDATEPVLTIYRTILASHVVLAMGVPVLAGITIYRGLTEQWERHKRLARITFPIWLYVSVTGVIIYLMLYHWRR
jgi:protein SCO1/2/putative membrane protein